MLNEISIHSGYGKLKDAFDGISRIEASLLILFPVLFTGFFFMGTQLHRLVFYALLVLYIAFCIKKKRIAELSKDKLLWLTLGGFLGYSFVSCFWSFDADWERVLQKLKLAPLVALFVFAFADMIRRRPFLWQVCLDALIGSAVITGTLLLLINYEQFWNVADGARLQGWGEADNSVQCGLLYGLALIALLFSKRHRFEPLNSRKVKFFAALVLFTVMLLTVSRGPFIALALTVLTYLLLRKDWKKVAAVALLGLIALGVISNLSIDVASMEQRAGYSYRVQVWEQVYQKFSERPLLGYGAAHKFYYEVTRESGSSSSISHPHSLYLSTLMQSGLIGLALLGSCIVLTAWRSYHLFREGRDRVCLLIFTMGLVFGLADHGGAYTNFSSVWLTFWIPLAASAALYSSSGEAKEGKSGGSAAAAA